jgi:choline kinase
VNVGIARFGAEGARVLIEEMDALVADGDQKAWVPRAFKAFAERRPLHAVGTRGFPWTEIDFPEDYRHAVEVVLPHIERDRSALRRPA